MNKQKSSLWGFMRKWPSFLIKVFAFLMLPLYLVAPMWAEGSLIDALKEWKNNWKATYIDED